jgi:hypothetical protein
MMIKFSLVSVPSMTSEQYLKSKLQFSLLAGQPRGKKTEKVVGNSFYLSERTQLNGMFW